MSWRPANEATVVAPGHVAEIEAVRERRDTFPRMLADGIRPTATRCRETADASTAPEIKLLVIKRQFRQRRFSVVARCRASLTVLQESGQRLTTTGLQVLDVTVGRPTPGSGLATKLVDPMRRDRIKPGRNLCVRERIYGVK